MSSNISRTVIFDGIKGNCSVGLENYEADLSTVHLFRDYPELLLQLTSACYILFMVIGIFGNLITICALARCKQARTIINPYYFTSFISYFKVLFLQRRFSVNGYILFLVKYNTWIAKIMMGFYQHRHFIFKKAYKYMFGWCRYNMIFNDSIINWKKIRTSEKGGVLSETLDVIYKKLTCFIKIFWCKKIMYLMR